MNIFLSNLHPSVINKLHKEYCSKISNQKLDLNQISILYQMKFLFFNLKLELKIASLLVIKSLASFHTFSLNKKYSTCYIYAEVIQKIRIPFEYLSTTLNEPV